MTLSEKIYDAGTSEAVLVALKYCYSSKIEVPEWVRTAYVIAAKKLYAGECKTLDEAFGRKRSRGKRGKTHKLSHEDKQRLYERVREMRNHGIALDDGLFTLVGQEFDIGKTLTKGYYYQWAKTHNRPSCDPVVTVLEHAIWAIEAMTRIYRREGLRKRDP